MAITTLDGYIAGPKQKIPWRKTNSITTVAGIPFSLIDRAGYPAAGSLNPGNVASGVIFTDATAGFPPIDNFQGGNKGYLTNAELTWPVGGSLVLYDLIFGAGQTTIPTTGTTPITLTSIPDYSARIPYLSDGVTKDYTSLEMFVLMSVAGSNHAHSITVNYLDQDNNAATSASISTQNMIVNRLLPVPLLAGDTGTRGPTGYTVTGIASATGAVSVLLMRRLATLRTFNLSNVFGIDTLGMPEIKQDAAILPVALMDSTSSSTPDLNFTITQG
jgi:hypothetical protein